MTDKETIQVIADLNMLARKSGYGIHPFSTATEEDAKGILYDDTKGNGTVYGWITSYAINGTHHDIISVCRKGEFYGFTVAIIVDDNGKPYVQISDDRDDSFGVIIENGEWYTV